MKLKKNLPKQNMSSHGKRYIPSKQKLCCALYLFIIQHCFVSEKNIDDFISAKRLSFFERWKVDDSFLHECSTLWSNNILYQEAINKVLSLRAVNDTPERTVKLMQDFHGLITVEEEQKQFLLR